MEPAAVHGEKEALRQFFRGHDVRHVLDSSVEVDTSILEQYLTSDFNAFALPESPPESEICSPEQISDFQTELCYGSARPVDGGGHAPLPDGYAFVRHSADRSKRKRSESMNSSLEPDGVALGGEGDGTRVGGSLTWTRFRPDDWNPLLDVNFRTMLPPVLTVETDKGFNFSPADEAFVCQKKNHFQVTVHVGATVEPTYVRTPDGMRRPERLEIQVFGIKMESPERRVTMEQSQADRSKKPLRPVRVALANDGLSNVTLGRLHFAETTANNMRKKGRPNPDQRYFQMVVGLYAAVGEEIPDGEPSLLLSALVSERLIVRASNPGQFEMDGDSLWRRGAERDAVACHGRVGINTDAPDEALVVCGNATVMGRVMQPSDQRTKQNIRQVDPEEQLRRITQMRLVEFDYRPEFASKMGIEHAQRTGVLAQEVKELLPSAVKEVGDVTCHDGHKIDKLLVVDKEQIFMENVGAVQQLSKMADSLETRVTELEVWKRRLAKLKSLTGSLRSSGTSRKQSIASTPPTLEARPKSDGCLSRRAFRAGVLALCLAVAVCIVTIGAIHLLEVTQHNLDSSAASNSSEIPPTASAGGGGSTAPPISPPGPWPPDMHFCHLLYCNTEYCCPSPAEDDAHLDGAPAEKQDRDDFLHNIQSSADWTNTTIESFVIKENRQVIDSRYCVRDECGPERFVFQVPVSPFVPVNMRVTLLMNSTELLVVHLCASHETSTCAGPHDRNLAGPDRYPPNTQGEHEWPLRVARLYRGSYHFRATVAGQADCSTDHHFQGALFTDYHFYFFRRCDD
ncbi:myelin regulatory factor-like protein [Stigmatopora nigra]